MRIEKVCVLGGAGFVGSHLVARLNNAGKSVRVVTRRRQRHRDLLVLPRVEVVQGDINDAATLRDALSGMDAVVNLVGILNEFPRRGDTFRDLHVQLTKNIVQAGIDTGIQRMLHMSALHADAGRGSSLYLRTKGDAENHAHTFAGSRLAVTSFRPSVIFGPGDGLFNRFAALLTLTPVLPLACAGARFAPVYVGDVVNVMADALEDPRTFDQHIDLCGPEVFTLREIVDYTANLTGRRTRVVALPDWMSRLQASLLEFAPGKPFSRDNYDSLQTDSVCGDTAPQPTSVHAIVPQYLASLNREQRYQQLRTSAGR